MSEKKTNASGMPPAPEIEPTLNIEVAKYKSLITALTQGRWWRFIVFVFLVGCILFTGIATVALAIKRLYPYSDITTNGLGATTIKNEKSEVSYWLFNTAILWANSGVSVEKGDIISIRCSGKFNTAMHHLYNAAKDNTKLSEEWTGPEGDKDDPNNRSGSYYRRKFRIFPGLPTGALVMQVVNNEPFDSPSDGNGAKAEDFYFIGGEREHIYINNPGTLYFGLNDIVFNDRTIIGMLKEEVNDARSFTDALRDRFQDELTRAENQKEEQQVISDSIIAVLSKYYKKAYQVDFDYLADTEHINNYSNRIETLETENNKKAINSKIELDTFITNNKEIIEMFDERLPKLPKRIIEKKNQCEVDLKNLEDMWERGNRADLIKKYKESLHSLSTEVKSGRAIGKMRLGVATDKQGELVSELVHYHEEHYKAAWLEDNVGSFLIVIEKTQK